MKYLVVLPPPFLRKYPSPFSSAALAFFFWASLSTPLVTFLTWGCALRCLRSYDRFNGLPNAVDRRFLISAGRRSPSVNSYSFCCLSFPTSAFPFRSCTTYRVKIPASAFQVAPRGPPFFLLLLLILFLHLIPPSNKRNVQDIISPLDFGDHPVRANSF